MERPILELLEAKRSYIEGDVSVDLWRRDIERYAPGYLDAEARGEGMGLDYDHDNFRTQGELWSMSQE